MRGLFVVGTGPGARERGVAAALARAAEEAGAGAATFAAGDLDAAAPPAIAARHAGAELDPERLVDEARAAADGDALLIAATSGGPLAPLAERYPTRDLASELQLPVVIATPAAAGLMNGTLLSLEAARGAGLTPAAIVISGWPDPPSRALLDERAALERRVSLPIEQLPGDEPSW